MNKKCQVFTPTESVNQLLDSVGYVNDIYGKKVIDNACGDGNILKEIVTRYIISSRQQKLNNDEIKVGLESDIWGSEIDKKQYRKCIRNLGRISNAYEIENVRWNINNKDFLNQTFQISFDFIVGNPPYITYKELDKDTRNFLRSNFSSCKLGKFDYCYAFIEKSLLILNESGKLVYLIPSSIFKNVFAEELRNIILPYIVDYTTQKLFKNILTSSSILICDKGRTKRSIKYKDVINSTSHSINKKSLINKWRFSSFDILARANRKFGDYFSASITVATLLNQAYVIKQFTENEDYFLVEDYHLEKAVTRIGVSPRSLNYNKSEIIIFPYLYKNRQLIKFKDNEFEKNYPEATRYLKKNINKLKNRQSDKSAKWFEYGRSQSNA